MLHKMLMIMQFIPVLILFTTWTMIKKNCYGEEWRKGRQCNCCYSQAAQITKTWTAVSHICSWMLGVVALLGEFQTHKLSRLMQVYFSLKRLSIRTSLAVWMYLLVSPIPSMLSTNLGEAQSVAVVWASRSTP